MSAVNLNDDQAEAVTYDITGNLLVLGTGAGSGKTRTLTERIVHMVRSGVPPRRILAVTFTTKAADEMKERILAALDDDKATVDKLDVRTFHSFCFRLVSRFARNAQAMRGAGGNSEITSLRTISQPQILDILQECLAAIRRSHGDHSGVTRGVAGEMAKLIAACKVRGLGPDAPEVKQHPNLHLPAAYVRYEAALAEQGAIDFGDMIQLAVKLLEGDAEVARTFASAYTCILVDEFQDTSLMQWRVLGAMVNHPDSAASITAVGDQNQQIYSFRGADSRCILEFMRLFGSADRKCKVIKLRENYRSTRTIVAAAAHLLKAASRAGPKRSRGPAGHDTSSPALFSRKSQGQPIHVLEASSSDGEAALVFEQIKQLLTSGASRPGDIGVLFRNSKNNFVRQALMVLLDDDGIPYVGAGGSALVQRPEIRNIAAYLALAVDESDDDAFERVINVPARSIGKVTLSALRRARTGPNASLMAAARSLARSPLLKRAQRGAVGAFVKTIDAIAGAASGGVLDLRSVVATTIAASKYKSHLKRVHASLPAPTESESQSEAQTTARAAAARSCAKALAALDQLLDVATKFQARVTLPDAGPSAGRGLLPLAAAFARSLVGKPMVPEHALDLVAHDAVSGITFSTIHRAKGLEWKVVFIIAAAAGVMPFTAGGSAALGGSDSDAEEKLDEERRLLHVAMTRAKSRLFISFSGRPSPFLADLPPDALAHVKADDAPAGSAALRRAPNSRAAIPASAPQGFVTARQVHKTAQARAAASSSTAPPRGPNRPRPRPRLHSRPRPSAAASTASSPFASAASLVTKAKAKAKPASPFEMASQSRAASRPIAPELMASFSPPPAPPVQPAPPVPSKRKRTAPEATKPSAASAEVVVVDLTGEPRRRRPTRT
ncbi:UvrD/REP helicase [Thecamonas trahens ATCC 50062]|uniref:DNA 3'-5' helicase n=1 Tax=Thecamonas trahens ATCC 50062 TaxID=461836 RepID=A0A0L0DNU3_THETB|nr:UvrD/REP helicase [Thecamonas trahens ATCC 50062]KNC53681.1 UvrD/REP helicase [Thecamonas trahens ATCC 50062]|eukprot:XP_013761995.1 UvrD/REP helicase [Thecamonas trahens ATCC 50062]